MRSEGDQTQKAATVILGKRPAQKGESKSEARDGVGGSIHAWLQSQEGSLEVVKIF